MRKCEKGKPCGATCIEKRKICREGLQQGISNSLTSTSGLINDRPEKKSERSKEEQIAALEKHRQQGVNAFFKTLAKDRGDGQGSHFENPNENSFKIMAALHKFSEETDSKLNRLEGKELVPFKNKDGTVEMIEPKRWYPDQLSLDKISEKYRNNPTEARKRYEEELIESYLSKGEKSEKPQAIMMMGGPASGKSTLIKTMFGGDSKGFVVIDPDDVKRMLPEFMMGLGQGYKNIAGDTHATSARITNEILRRAQERGLNILVDGTGANTNVYTKTINELKERGNPYTIQILAQHISKEEGIARALLRAELPLSMEGGRYVPPHIIENAYNVIPGNFFQFVKKSDSAILNDGGNNKVIARYENGKIVQSDEPAMIRYTREAKGG